jgi:hypothetical protein
MLGVISVLCSTSSQFCAGVWIKEDAVRVERGTQTVSVQILEGLRDLRREGAVNVRGEAWPGV